MVKIPTRLNMKNHLLNKTTIIFALMSLVLINGCSLTTIAVRSTGTILDAGFESLMSEDDLVLAKTAIESDLKLLEGLLRADPENKKLLLLAAQGFTSYALAFVEDENPERAEKLYLRGRDYGSKWLEKSYGINLLEMNDLDEFNSAVNGLPGKAVPGVFWMGNAWASSILLSLDDVSAVADLVRTETMMKFVLENNESYYYAGAHLFFCAYYGGRPRMLGGDPEKASYHIQRQQELGGKNFLIGELFKVKYVDLPAFDEDSAREGLEKILRYDLELAPEIRLVNRIAQKKAEVLLKNLDEYL